MLGNAVDASQERLVPVLLQSGRTESSPHKHCAEAAAGELEAEQGTPPQGKQSLAAVVPPAQLQHWVETWQKLAAAASAVGSRKRPLRWQHCCELLALLLSSLHDCSTGRRGPLAVCVAATAAASVTEEVSPAWRSLGPVGCHRTHVPGRCKKGSYSSLHAPHAAFSAPTEGCHPCRQGHDVMLEGVLSADGPA